MKTIFSALFTCILLISLMASAHADDGIDNTFDVEIYSNIQSCDVTIYSSSIQENMILEIKLLRKGRLLDQKILEIDSISPDSRNIKVVSWDVQDTDDGVYTVQTKIIKDGVQLHSQDYDFVHGRQIIPKIIVEDILPNSEGFSIVIEPKEPVLVDIEYMLVEGEDVVYTIEDENVPLHTNPIVVQNEWGVLLVNNKEYQGRVKIRSYTPSLTTIAFMQAFTARDDVEITDVYEDEIGASVTLEGRSQVPFEGSVRFTVIEKIDGQREIIESVNQPSPILLTEDDETIEVIWNRRLQRGVYELIIEVIGNDGDVIERKETIIESKGSAPYTNVEQEPVPEENTPGFLVTQLILGAIAAIFVYRRL